VKRGLAPQLNAERGRSVVAQESTRRYRSQEGSEVTGFDMTESIAPKSDQLNAEDLLSGPRTFTIKEVRKGFG
jgi:hypothetical protein